jgi:hypothetical protein
MPIDQSSRLRIGDAKVHRMLKQTEASDPSFSISSMTDGPALSTGFRPTLHGRENGVLLDFSAFYSTFYLRD